MEASTVSGHLRRCLESVAVDGDGIAPTQSIVDIGMEEIEVMMFEEGKKKPRDADKLHQGFALVRFERAATVEKACKALHGWAMGVGARSTLTASVARARVEKEKVQRDQEEEEARKMQKQIEVRRAHNLGQKRRRVERMEQELESIFDHMSSPGGKHAITKWRFLPDACIDWESLPDECDPAKGGGLGPDAERGKWSRKERPKEETCAAAQARTLRKRVQVESFHLLLSQMLPPPNCVAVESTSDPSSNSPPTTYTVVDFGCGTGNLTLPLAALMPHVHFIGVRILSDSL